MVVPHGGGDLYHKYRPRRFSEVVGHQDAVKSIKAAINSASPTQSYLLVGESGTGKTTSARIMALLLNCESKTKEFEPCLECQSCKIIMSGSCIDIIEKNAADFRGIDTVREISSNMAVLPMSIDKKVYILDEFHQMTKEAQSSLLKVLEEAPRHVVIILCTTNPEKILPTVKNRCQTFVFKSLRKTEIIRLLEEVCAFEAVDFGKEILSAVADAAEGSPRNSLVQLQKVIQLGAPTLEEALNVLNSGEQGRPEAYQLASLLYSGKYNWGKVMELYTEMSDIGPAGIGMIVAGTFRNKLIKATTELDAARLSQALELFINPFMEGKPGENQLVLALYKTFKIFKAATGTKNVSY